MPSLGHGAIRSVKIFHTRNESNTMKALALSLFLMLSATQVIAAPNIEGRWYTVGNRAIVKISRCGKKFCGVIVSSPFRPSYTDTMVLQFLQETIPGVWSGKGYDPLKNTHYKVSVYLDGDRLVLDGCKTKGNCGKKSWTRT